MVEWSRTSNVERDLTWGPEWRPEYDGCGLTRLKAEVERQSLGSSSALQLMIGLVLHGYRAGYHLRLVESAKSIARCDAARKFYWINHW